MEFFVLIVGFCGGLFAGVGVDPEKEIIKAVAPHLLLVFGLFLFLIFILRLLIAYSLGGVLGIFAVMIAFISGYIITDPPSAEFGVILLFVAVFLGWIAFPEGQQYIQRF